MKLGRTASAEACAVESPNWMKLASRSGPSFTPSCRSEMRIDDFW
jgi:hypothetical protein